MAKDANIGNKTSSTTRSAKNLLVSVDMAEDAEIAKSNDGNDGNDKMVIKSFSKKLSGPIGYLTSLRSNADSVLFEKR